MERRARLTAGYLLRCDPAELAAWHELAARTYPEARAGALAQLLRALLARHAAGMAPSFAPTRASEHDPVRG